MQLLRRSALGTLVIGLCVGTVMLTNLTEASADSDTLKIGALLCLSGDCAEWGNNSLKGMQLATDEINQAGGVLGKQLSLVVQDSQDAGGGARIISALRELLLNKNVHFVVGPTWSVGGLPIAPIIAQQRELIVISPSVGVAKFNETSDNIFNLWPHDSYASEGLARFAFAHGWKNIAIFSGNEPWVQQQGDTFEKELIRLGGRVTIKVEVNPNTTDISSEALRIASSKPDAVFYADVYHMAQAARRLRDLRYRGAQLSILMDDTRVHEANGALEGTFFASYPESKRSFQEAFQKRFGAKPGITADTAYDAVQLYAQVLNRATSIAPRSIIQDLLKTNYDGASGQVVFDTYGGVVRAPSFFIVRGNEFQPVD